MATAFEFGGRASRRGCTSTTCSPIPVHWTGSPSSWCRAGSRSAITSAPGRCWPPCLARALREPLARFVARGGLVLGVCNGFQVLVRMGLVPGVVDGDSVGDVVAVGARAGAAQSVALVHNDSGQFEDRWVQVAFDAASPCVWTRGIASLELPVRHGEGKLVAPEAQLAAIDAAHLGAARYTSSVTAAAADGGSPLPYPANPNGSLRNLAGLCDPTGQVFGLMPTPRGVPVPLPPPRLAQRRARRQRPPRRGRTATVPQRRPPRHHKLSPFAARSRGSALRAIIWRRHPIQAVVSP